MESGPSLEQVFSSYTGGAKDMDSRTFAKLAKDTGIYDKKFTATDADIIFTKSKDKGAKKITFAQFKNAIDLVAQKKGVKDEDVINVIVKSGGPKYTGTKAEYNKFHDDKSQYTGVYAKGGPTNVDAGKGNISDISQLCDRKEADVRGVKK